MALDARDAKVAELTQALTARVWVEQAKGHWWPLRRWTRPPARERRSAPWPTWPGRWCRTPQRDRTAVIATERARSRAAEARAAHAEAALEAAQAEASQKDAGADGPPASPRGHHHSL
jgi:hypothetical protein